MTDTELIKAVAEKVMGWRHEPAKSDTWEDEEGHLHSYSKPEYWFDERNKAHTLSMFNPLTNLNHAFMVVEKMRELGFFLTIQWLGGPPDGWRCTFNRPLQEHYCAYGDDLGRAICLAALKAKEAK